MKRQEHEELVMEFIDYETPEQEPSDEEEIMEVMEALIRHVFQEHMDVDLGDFYEFTACFTGPGG